MISKVGGMTDREIIASNLNMLSKKEVKELFDEKNKNYAKFGVLFVEEAMRRARQDQDWKSSHREMRRIAGLVGQHCLAGKHAHNPVTNVAYLCDSCWRLRKRILSGGEKIGVQS